jgi:hypothetical protein
MAEDQRLHPEDREWLEEIRSVERQIENAQRNLDLIEEKIAEYTKLEAPIHLLRQQEDEQKRVAELETRLAKLRSRKPVPEDIEAALAALASRPLTGQGRGWLRTIVLLVVGATVIGGLFALFPLSSQRDQVPAVTSTPMPTTATPTVTPQPTPVAAPTSSPVPQVTLTPTEEPTVELGIRVLLAPFTDENGVTSPTGNAITADIREKLDDIGELDRASSSEMPVRVVTVDAIAPQKGREEAEQVMAAQGGDVLIWGWYSESETNLDIHPRFELSEQIGRFAPQSEKFIIVEVKKQQLELEVELAGGVKMSERQLRQELSDRIVHLVNYTIGLIRYEKDTDIAIALDNFRTALQYATEQGDTLGQKLIRFYVADLLRRQDKKEEAIEEFNRAAAITTDSPLGPDFDAVIYVRTALCYMLLGHLDQAETALESAIQANPDYPEAHNDLATIYFETDRLEDAISEFGTALHLLEETGLADDPYYCGVQWGLGTAYVGRYEEQQKEGDREKALEALDAVIACAECTGMEWLKELGLAERKKVE